VKGIFGEKGDIKYLPYKKAAKETFSRFVYCVS
jgi:hypothetical protein